MKAAKIAHSLILICALYAQTSTLAEVPQENAREVVGKGDFDKAYDYIRKTVSDAARTDETFRPYLKEVSDGIEIALSRKEISDSDVLSLMLIVDLLDDWTRPLSNGNKIYLDFVKSVATASKSARPASFAGKLECQMQVILFSLAITQKDVAAAESARKSAIELSKKYEGEDGVVTQCDIPSLDVPYFLISKNSSAALTAYKSFHEKFVGLEIVEITIWQALKLLKENGTALGELEEVCKTLDGKFNKGVKIRSVVPDSAAAKAGWRKNDRIIEIDGKTLFYNPDNMGIPLLQATLARRRNTPNRKPTIFKLKRGESFFTSEISADLIGIEF